MAGIPQISHSSTSPKYTQQGFNTTFRVVANDTQLGRARGRYAVKGMAARRVAVVDDRTAYGQGLVTEFAKALQQRGETIVARHLDAVHVQGRPPHRAGGDQISRTVSAAARGERSMSRAPRPIYCAIDAAARLVKLAMYSASFNS
jgi:hypothetical protein